MAMVIEIKVTDPESRFKHALRKVAYLTIQNRIGHPEAPHRANYEAKYFTPKGNLVETVVIEDYERSNGAFNLLKRVLNTNCPTRERFMEADLAELIDGSDFEM